LGTAEVVALAVSAISFLATLLIGVLAWNAKSVAAEVRELEKKLAEADKRVAVLEASQLHDRVDEHGVRLVAIENGLHDIRSDVRVVKLWVESQGSPDRHRRSTDQKG
jgi:hypothetical protein